jgi:hypothetical protein
MLLKINVVSRWQVGVEQVSGVRCLVGGMSYTAVAEEHEGGTFFRDLVRLAKQSCSRLECRERQAEL